MYKLYCSSARQIYIKKRRGFHEVAAIIMRNGWLMFKYSLLPALAILIIMRYRILQKIMLNTRNFSLSQFFLK